MKTKEKLAVRILMIVARILLGYSFNEEYKKMYEEINNELKTADHE